MLPRFVASTGTTHDPIVDDPGAVEDVRSIVRLRGRRATTELVIGTERTRIGVFSDRETLSQRGRSQISFHEVASGRTVDLEIEELYVFDVQMLEMLPDAPGLNDALYLYGSMRGPYPAALGKPTPPIDGQLIVTRADLLAALVDGVTNAFAYAPDQHGARCVHAVLPGAPADVIDGGTGVVLALPLAPDWTLECPVANDLVVAQLIYDVLSALRTDLGVADSVPPLPVPSRAALEEKLVKEGWRVEGDEAVRAKGRGLIGSIFKGEERRKLPRQGSLDELVTEAKAVLSRIPETAEAAALRRRTRRSASAVVAQPPPHVPTPPSAPVPTVAPAAAPRPRVEASPSDWMKDFVEAHRSPSRPAPRVSAPARAITHAAPPAWIEDFSDPGADSGEKSNPDEKTPSNRPDWSKDFD